MGGGKKKQSLKQMTKPKKTKESKRKEQKSAPSKDVKKPLGLTMPDVNNQKVLGTLKGMKVLTPSVVASRFNIRLSLAKIFLAELEKRKMIEYVSGGKNLKIYKMLT
jgi:small subunit ribosomal protein S25e